MSASTIAHDYFNRFAAANNETVRKEHFSNYLNHAFGKNDDARAIINEFAAGAEHKVLNIRKMRGGGVKAKPASPIRSTAGSS
jgi:hypothetical protein